MTWADWGMLSLVWAISRFRRSFSARWPMSLWVYQNSNAPNTGSSMTTISHVIFAEGSIRLFSRYSTIPTVKMTAPP